MANRRIGVFGGTFDPIHYGHLIMAEQCREQLGLGRVLFVPANQSPFKEVGASSPAKHRCEMLRLAIAGHNAFEVEVLELERPGPSYTVDTLTQLSAAQPDTDWMLLMGSDSLASFPRWRDARRIVELATPVVVMRPGSSIALSILQPLATEQRWPKIQQAVVSSPLVDLSSRDIRARVAAGRSIRFMTPRAVEIYVATNRLYQTSAMER